MTTYTSQPDDTTGIDTHIDNSAPTTNKDGTDLRTGENNTGAIVYRTLIKFDLSSIPAGSTVISATLSLWTEIDRSTNTRSVDLFRMIQSWTEAGATWNTYNGSNNWPGGAGAFGAADCDNGVVWATKSLTGTESVDTEFQWSFSATGITELQKMINGTYTNNGWMLKTQTESDDAWIFHDSGDGTSGYRPKLVIEYTPPSGFFF